MQPTIVRLLGLGLILDLVLILPTVLAQSACSFAQDGTTPTGNGVCNCFESQNPMGWIVDCSKKFLIGVPTGLPAETVYLSLNENSITALSPISLEGLSSLEILQIQNNGLRSDLIEDGAFANLSNLKSLDLSNNRIALSSAMIRHLLPLTRLQTLTLTNNNINTIDSSAVEIFDRLDTLDLTSNVFVCDCDLSWFRNWLLNTGHVGHQITGATCSSPLEYQREEITGAGFCSPSVCILCNGGSDAECNSQPSAIQTCSSTQGACFNEIRVSNGVYSIQKSCKQIQACLNQVRSNARQCNAGTSDSVCRTCCLGDLCNRPASGVLNDYTLPGFPRDPSLVVETTTPFKTTVTEATTGSATTETTNKYTTVNDTVDMITTSSATLETTKATTSATTMSETTATETTTLPDTTSKNTPTIATTLTSRETSVSEIQTLSGKTTMVLQTTPSPKTSISNTLTPLVTHVSPTSEDAVKTTPEQTQTSSISTTPLLQSTPISNTLTPLVTRVSPTTGDSVKTTLEQTQTPSIGTTPVSVSTIGKTHVSTSKTTTFSTLLSTAQEETTDSTTQYTSEMSTPTSLTYSATQTTPISTTSLPSSPPSTSPFLTSSLETVTTTTTSPMSTFESVEMTPGSVTTPISTQTVLSKEATTIPTMESSTPISTQTVSSKEATTIPTMQSSTPLLTQTVSFKEATTIPTMQSSTPISTQTVLSKEATTILTMQSSTRMSTDTDTFTSTTPLPSQANTPVRTTPLPPATTSSTSAITTLLITTPVLDTSLSTTFQSIAATSFPNSTPESETPQTSLKITTTPATSSSPTSHEILDTTLTALSDTVQTSQNTPTSPLTTLGTTLGTTKSGSGTTETFTKLTSTLNTPTSTLATTQTTQSTQSTPGTSHETTIPTTLPHVQSTTASPSTTLGKTFTTLYSDTTSISYTTRMSSATPSTDAPIPSSTVSTVSVYPTTDPSNTTPTPVTGISSSNPERSTFQYTTPTSTPTYSSTLMNTDPQGTTSGSRTTPVPSTAPSTKPSTTSMGVSSTTPSTSTLSPSSESTTLSSTSVRTAGSSSAGSTQVSSTSSTSTAQTPSSPSGTTSPTSSSYSSTQQPNKSTTGSSTVTTIVGRPSTTAAPTPHCPEETTSGEFGAITWLRTPGTQTAEVECPYGSNNQQSATATRFCRMKRADVTWDDPNTSSCATSSQVLQRLSEVPITVDNAQTVSKNLTTVTSSPTELNETDVDLAVDVLENLARSITEYNSAAVVENAVDAINNLAGAMMETLVAGQRDAEIAARVLHLIDEFALHVDFDGDMFEAVSDRIDVVVVKITTEMINGLSFRSVVDENDTSKPQLSFNQTNPESTAEASASLELPGSLFEAHRGEIDRVQFVIYKDVIFFEVITEATQNSTAPTPPTTPTGDGVIERDALNSLVISASLGDLKISGLRDPVKTSFIHQRPERADNPSCVFWDFEAADGKGSWSTEGCIASVTAEGSTQCECDHLTNFALLMDIYGTTTTFNGDHMMALSIITFAGCTLSILGLVVTFFSYIMIRIFKKAVNRKRQLRSDRRTRVLLNLVVALTFMNICFLTDAVLTEFGHPGEVACKLLGALLHYGLLTSIAWMALEAWHMYLALVKVFDSYTSHLMKKMCVIGWGLPAVIVGILLGVDLDHYDFYNEFCWLKVGGIPFYASFVAPSLAVILFNFIIFSLVTNQLCSLRRRSVAASSEQFDVSAQLRASLSITVLLGLTWGLGIFMIGEASLVFSYLFAIFNSFQGFSIFVFHCLLKEEVRLGWRKVFCPQCLTLEEMTKSSSGQNFSSSNKQAQLQKRMTLEYQVTTVESNGRHHQSQSTPFHPEHEVPRFNPFATNSEFYQDSRI